jgi:hypothetical protein
MRHLVIRRALVAGVGVAAAAFAAVWLTPAAANADPLPPFDPNDFAISIDGITLFQVGTATATSSIGDFAIADGAGSQANATAGFFDSAFAYGDNSGAGVENGNFDQAIAIGAATSIVDNGSFDTASAAGAGAAAEAAGGNFDTAIVNGDNSQVLAGFGSNDVASVFGVNGEAAADYGNGDVASAVNTGTSFDFAIAGGTGTSLLGSYDIASIVGTGSDATAGAEFTSGNFDLAAAFGDMLSPFATGNFMTDIQP